MVERLRISSGAASPLLVSVAGVSPAGANYTQLVFNGNTPPLRVWQTGAVAFSRSGDPGALPLPFPIAGPGGFATPGGTFPLFTVAMTRNNGGLITNTPVRGIGSGGSGGGLMSSSGQFIALDFGLPGAPSSGWVNFLVYRNYG